VRVQLRITLPVHRRLPDGSYLSSLAPKSMRSDIALGKGRRIDRYEVPVRVVDYTITNRSGGEPETIRLLTSIIDHELAPAAELAALYHQRWEIELALDEIQTRPWGLRRCRVVVDSRER
jgi:IS4 transposase